MALFQRRRSLRVKPEDRQFGLCVPPRAIVIMKKGEKVDGVSPSRGRGGQSRSGGGAA
jgi:hypothetical protein